MMPNKAKPFSPEEWPDVVFNGTVVFNSNLWYPVYTLLVGHPGETVDDVQDTIDMMYRLEYDVPEKVGRERHHFFVGPFPWIANWGIVTGKSFDFAEDMAKGYDAKGNLIEDPRLALKRIELFDFCYRHMVKELTHPPKGVVSSPWLSTGFTVFGPLGYYYFNQFVEKTMRNLGRKFERQLEERAQNLIENYPRLS